ncbi:MAG: GGDEF domain-containing protein [Candidatus Omnitrophica bacterium]|nr:GGDEF domain-containing protein [Candidatus Omnitrophota bacterium]
MEEAGWSVNCPHRIEDVLEVLNKEISGSKNKRTLPPIALLLVDIDNLERVNRWYGRNTGNEVLSETAGLLRRILGPDDFLARFGGDEFLLLFRRITLKDAKEKASKIIESLKNHDFASDRLKISASIGIAHYFSFAFSSDELLGCAVEALALAQKEGGTFKVFMEEEEWNEV